MVNIVLLPSSITPQFLAEASVWVVLACIAIIVIALIVIFFRSRKSVEEKHALKILSHVNKIRVVEEKQPEPVKENQKQLVPEERLVPKTQTKPAVKLQIGKDESTLKHLLVRKFQPKIEQQLNAKVVINDFNAKDNTFLALVEISGVKVLLTLDPSGKIIDYKKIK